MCTIARVRQLRGFGSSRETRLCLARQMARSCMSNTATASQTDKLLMAAIAPASPVATILEAVGQSVHAAHLLHLEHQLCPWYLGARRSKQENQVKCMGNGDAKT